MRGRVSRLEAIVTRGDCLELHLGASAPGRRVLLWPFDRPKVVDVAPRLRAVPLREWLSFVTHAAAGVVDPVTPRAPVARVDVLPYQLDPALAMAAGACRLLLADEVGLGKTIQAGWIVADLLAREPDARVLLAVPASLKDQWLAELRRRFAIEAIAADSRWLRDAVAGLPADNSPWTMPAVYVVSLDFLKRPDIARGAAGS